MKPAVGSDPILVRDTPCGIKLDMDAWPERTRITLDLLEKSEFLQSACLQRVGDRITFELINGSAEYRVIKTHLERGEVFCELVEGR